MRHIQLVIELYVPRNYAEGFAPWCSSCAIGECAYYNGGEGGGGGSLL